MNKPKSVKFQSFGNVVILPAPEFGNLYRGTDQITVGRTMTGGSRVFIKPNPEKVLKYNFILTERKRTELFSFLYSHNADLITITDWKGSIFVGYLLTNPISSNSSGNDKVELELEFQGLKLL